MRVFFHQVGGVALALNAQHGPTTFDELDRAILEALAGDCEEGSCKRIVDLWKTKRDVWGGPLHFESEVLRDGRGYLVTISPSRDPSDGKPGDIQGMSVRLEVTEF